MSLYIKKRKKLLRKILVGSGLFLIGLTGFLITNLVFSKFFPEFQSTHPLFSVLMTTLLFVLAYKPLDIAVTQLFRNYLFKNKSYGHIALMNLADELALILDHKEFSNLIVNTFGEVLHMKTVGLVLLDRMREDYGIVSGWGWQISEAKRVRLPKHSPLLEHIRKGGPHVLVRDRIVRALSWQEANSLAYEFDRLRASWIMPLFVGKELVGLLGFSAKNPELTFDEYDFLFFREFASRIAVNAMNSIRYHELQCANEELQDAQAELLQSTKLSAIEQLATGIAHEIHNPLTIISGKAQVLLLQKDRTKFDERVADVLKTIVQQTKRAADITRKLLMFSQGTSSLKEPVSLEQILQDTISLVSYQSSLDEIVIDRSCSGSIPMLYANVHEIREVFLNLILNSVQSIGSKGRIHIEMNDHPQDQFVEVLLTDSGKGIPEEDLEKLFNPFFTTNHESIGLGLFVTKQIIYRYGGSIRVESEVGHGSLFMVRFPYVGPKGFQMVQKGSEDQPLVSKDK